MAKFPAKLGAQVGVGQIYYKEGLLKKKTTSFKKSWHEYILPRRVRCHLSAWIWCWWARQDSLGCMKFTECAPKLSRGVSGKILQGRKVIQTTEFLKQTVNASDTRILNDLMYLIGTPHMFVCVGVDLMCHRYYIRYSDIPTSFDMFLPKYWEECLDTFGWQVVFWCFLFTCLSSQFHNLRLQASNSDPPGRFPVVWGCYSRLCEREQAEQKWCEWGIVRLYLYIHYW